LCLYVWNDACPSRVKSLNPAYLDGDTKLDNQKASPSNSDEDEISAVDPNNKGEVQVFVVDTFEVIFDKN
jgi:hypothetical protein